MVITTKGDSDMLKSKLKLRIVEKGILQKDLAERLGVSPQRLSMWVKGEANPRAEMMFRIARELECSIEDIWEYREE